MCVLAGCIGDDAGTPPQGSADGTVGMVATDGGGPAECFVSPTCDPLSPSCPGAEVCVSSQAGFSCTAPTEGMTALGAGEPCDGPVACSEGLACLSLPVTGCTGAPGCCVALCELDSPDCGAGFSCQSFFSGPPPPCYDNVGVCIEA